MGGCASAPKADQDQRGDGDSLDAGGPRGAGITRQPDPLVQESSKEQVPLRPNDQQQQQQHQREKPKEELQRNQLATLPDQLGAQASPGTATRANAEAQTLPLSPPQAAPQQDTATTQTELPPPPPKQAAAHTQTTQPELVSEDTQVTPRTSSHSGSSEGSHADLPELVSLSEVLQDKDRGPPLTSLRDAYAQQQRLAQEQEDRDRRHAQQQQENQALQEAHSVLQQEHQALQQQLSHIQQQQRQAAAAAVAGLDQLQQQHGALQQQHSDLQHWHSSLQQQHRGLKAMHTQLVQGLGDLHALLHSKGFSDHFKEDTQHGGRSPREQDQDTAAEASLETPDVQQLIADCKVQQLRLTTHLTCEQELRSELERMKLEQVSVHQAYEAAFDAGEAARVQVLRLQQELDEVRMRAPSPPPQERQRLVASGTGAQEEAAKEREQLQRALQEAEGATQALQRRLEDSERAAAQARKEAEELAAELRSNHMVNEQTAGQTDTLLKEYAQLKERHLALLQEWDAKHNMIDLLAHQFEEVTVPNLPLEAARRASSRRAPGPAVAGTPPHVTGSQGAAEGHDAPPATQRVEMTEANGAHEPG